MGVRGPGRGFRAKWRSSGRTESQAAGLPRLDEGPGSVEVPGARDPGAAGVPGAGVACPSGAIAGSLPEEAAAVLSASRMGTRTGRAVAHLGARALSPLGGAHRGGCAPPATLYGPARECARGASDHSEWGHCFGSRSPMVWLVQCVCEGSSAWALARGESQTACEWERLFPSSLPSGCAWVSH